MPYAVRRRAYRPRNPSYKKKATWAPRKVYKAPTYRALTLKYRK